MKKILIVDDDKALREMLKLTFSREKHMLLEAEDGEQAIEVAERELPDIILLDVMMPGMDGYQVCYKIKTTPALSKCIVVMLTARDQQNDMKRGVGAGADYYITKPFSTKALVILTEALLNGVSR